MAKERNDQLEVFRQRVSLFVTTFIKSLLLDMAEEGLAGTSPAEIRKMLEDPDSGWNKMWESLRKDLKRQAAGIVNLIHITAVLKGLK
jgi:hypothetical protein